MSDIEFEASDDADDLIEDPDVRAVSVVWAEDADIPDTTVIGCSKYEAIGLLVCGLAELVLGPPIEIEIDTDDDE
jgi:hypothetical protein